MLTFPSLPGLDVSVEREVFFKTTVHTSPSGKEDRTIWMNTPRITYTLKYNLLRQTVMAPAPLNSMDELTVLLYFLTTSYGQGDSFSFTDPYDGSQQTVRFASDSMQTKMIGQSIWECTFKLVTVL